MKKSLIALAIASAVSAPAFAATSNVDVYGKLHFAITSYDDNMSSSTANDVNFSSNASRIGFKGVEDLGGGLKGLWQIESGVNLDEQTGTLASRNSFVGLQGGFGTVLLGNHDTPLKLVGRAVDLFGDTVADSRNVMSNAHDARAQNVVAYISPTFSGVSIIAAYTNDLAGGTSPAPDAENESAYNLSVTYTNGGLYLGAAYGDGDQNNTIGLNADWRLAAGYTFGNFKLVGQYDAQNADTVAVGDYTSWMVGGAYTMGNVVLKANYMLGEFGNSQVAGGADKEQYTFGVDYNLSKRTGVYALYALGDNVTFGGGAGDSDQVAGRAGEYLGAFSVGVTHSF
jgi:predicted porin